MSPYRTAAKFNTAEKALGSLIGQPSVKLASLASPAFPPMMPRERLFSGQDVGLWLQSAGQKKDEYNAMWTRSLFFFILRTWQLVSRLAWEDGHLPNTALWEWKLKVKYKKSGATVKWMFDLVKVLFMFLCGFWLMWGNWSWFMCISVRLSAWGKVELTVNENLEVYLGDSAEIPCHYRFTDAKNSFVMIQWFVVSEAGR